MTTQPRPRVVFLGSSDTGWRCCRALFDVAQVVGIVTHRQSALSVSWSEKPVVNVRFRDLTDLGAEFGIPVIDAISATSFVDELRALRPDLLCVVGWYHLLPRRLLEVAPLGAVGVHASLLPRNRGGAPLVWAIINGESTTGVTLFHLGAGVDSGDIVAQTEIPIAPDATIADVVALANDAAVDLVRRHVVRVLDGSAPRERQDETAATVMPQRRPEDGAILWDRLSADAAHNFVRAQTRPYPGAFTHLGVDRVTIWNAARDSATTSSLPPGSIVINGGIASVVCADGRALVLREISIGALGPLSARLIPSALSDGIDPLRFGSASTAIPAGAKHGRES